VGFCDGRGVGKDGDRLGDSDGDQVWKVGDAVQAWTPAPVNRHFRFPPHAGIFKHGKGPVMLLGVVSPSAKLPMSRPFIPKLASVFTGPIGSSPVKLFWGRKISLIRNSRSETGAQITRGSRMFEDSLQFRQGSSRAFEQTLQLGPFMRSKIISQAT